ncbi:MAG TPA: hypothetical protein VK177_09830 [Flavobacteriales bacterium]|nr:hypothetical protein [Flavobacteriales bacterium]
MKLLVLFIANFYFTPKYDAFFGDDYALALVQVEKDATLIAQVSTQYGIDPLTVKSIVFPEYIRNNAVGALMEEAALDLVYVDMGADAVDFSIGTFQVKPSFAHNMENLIEGNEYLAKKYKNLVLVTVTDEKKQRSLRISRLKSTEWQTRYVCAFIDYCEQYYGLDSLPADEKIRFLATAYNAGLKQKKQEVELNYGLRVFPYGSKFKVEQVSYWGVSVDYYLKHKEI